jgi:D-serine dehydratase
MIKKELQHYIDEIPAVADAAALRETVWFNDKKVPFAKAPVEITDAQIQDAADRLQRFAPYIAKAFPETGNGIIESPFQAIPRMQEWIEKTYTTKIPGSLWIKRDSDLAVSGSVKARGGFYEVMKHAETLAIQAGMLKTTDDYSIMLEPRFKKFFSQYTVQVGSTGNLGMSIGLMSAQFGFKVIVHMSVDAKQWKKDKLRSKGVKVIEYETDYANAVKEGREASAKDPYSYFVDDEKSVDLFLGYTTAGKRLQKQLEENHIAVDSTHPLFVYVPCGIGGAPGGISYGIKRIYGDAAHCFFIEPTEACCMLLGLATGLYNGVSVQDFGISGKTAADGLAVTRSSALVGKVIEPYLSGEVTIEDGKLYDLMRGLYNTENIFIEPSSCACFAAFLHQDRMQEYYEKEHLADCMQNATHIVWATGGSLMPEKNRKEYLNTYLK